MSEILIITSFFKYNKLQSLLQVESEKKVFKNIILDIDVNIFR